MEVYEFKEAPDFVGMTYYCYTGENCSGLFYRKEHADEIINELKEKICELQKQREEKTNI